MIDRLDWQINKCFRLEEEIRELQARNGDLMECAIDMLNRLEFAKEVIPNIRGERKKYYDDCCNASKANYLASKIHLKELGDKP